MKSLYNLLKRGGTGLMAFATLDSYRRAVINDNKIKKSDSVMQDTITKYNFTVKQLQGKENSMYSDST